MSLADALSRLSSEGPDFTPGAVWLAGAGPGGPGCLTLDATGQPQAIHMGMSRLDRIAEGSGTFLAGVDHRGRERFPARKARAMSARGFVVGAARSGSAADLARRFSLPVPLVRGAFFHAIARG